MIKNYPEFTPLSLEMRSELYPSLNLLKDGISEFTFSGLYLFRETYNYSIARIPDQTLIISGSKKGERFFLTPCGLPDANYLEELHRTHDYHKNLSESQVEKYQIELEQLGYKIIEDRDNFDYLYHRKDLVELSGRDFHKKRNLVNAFINKYNFKQYCLNKTNKKDAIDVAIAWRDSKKIDGDTRAAIEGLENLEILGMRGCVYYVDETPVGYAMGEPIARARMFAVHFEKALEDYKGIYQFINQAFAKGLPSYIRTVNREQDLGDEGLRQAKMTYRPFGFVKKYRAIRKIL